MTTVRVEVEEEARRWIRERGGEVRLRESRRHGCCGGVAFVPEVRIGGVDPGRPSGSTGGGPDGLRSVEVGGVVVHLPRGLRTTGGPVRIGLDRFLGLGRLRVEGTLIRGGGEPPT